MILPSLHWTCPYLFRELFHLFVCHRPTTILTNTPTKMLLYWGGEGLGLLPLGLLMSLVVVELGLLGPLVIVELQQLVSLGLLMGLRLIVLVEYLLVDLLELEQLQGMLVGLELGLGP
jgi:hypothetical protein